MNESNLQVSETLDSYIRKVQDQELKAILLKLKNETRKPDAQWETVKTVLSSLQSKDRETLAQVIPLILK